MPVPAIAIVPSAWSQVPVPAGRRSSNRRECPASQPRVPLILCQPPELSQRTDVLVAALRRSRSCARVFTQFASTVRNVVRPGPVARLRHPGVRRESRGMRTAVQAADRPARQGRRLGADQRHAGRAHAEDGAGDRGRPRLRPRRGRRQDRHRRGPGVRRARPSASSTTRSWRSWRSATSQAEGVGERVRIIQGDIFETDFSSATVVTLYLLPELNLRLRPTILNMKPGTRVVSHSFLMDDWEPDERSMTEDGSAYLWIVPAQGRRATGRSSEPGGKGQFRRASSSRSSRSSADAPASEPLTSQCARARLADRHDVRRRTAHRRRLRAGRTAIASMRRSRAAARLRATSARAREASSGG